MPTVSRLPPAGVPLLELHPCAGFANRLRAIVSGMCAAQDIGRSLCIVWERQPGICSMRFQDVFDIAALPSWVYLNDGEATVAGRPTECLSPADWDRLKTTDTRVRLNLKSYGHFHQSDPARWTAHLQSLPFGKDLCRVAEFLVRPLHMCSERVGVHIRRTDNTVAIRDSPTAAFFPVLDALPPTTGFVVTSDDDSERKALKERYWGRTVTLAQTLDRSTAVGGIEAVLDFLALSRCSQIFGTAGSSFSEMAAAYGGCPLTVVRSPTLNA